MILNYILIESNKVRGINNILFIGRFSSTFITSVNIVRELIVNGSLV